MLLWLGRFPSQILHLNRTCVVQTCQFSGKDRAWMISSVFHGIWVSSRADRTCRTVFDRLFHSSLTLSKIKDAAVEGRLLPGQGSLVAGRSLAWKVSRYDTLEQGYLNSRNATSSSCFHLMHPYNPKLLRFIRIYMSHLA